MRITAPNVVNELIIYDPVSGKQITLYYRLPTTEERIKFNQSLFRREGKKVKWVYSEARQKWGREILIGFKEGAFGVMKEGKAIPYSSDPKSDNYREDWKDLVCEFASDVVEALATHVFESTTTVIGPPPESEEETPAPEVSPGGEGELDEKK